MKLIIINGCANDNPLQNKVLNYLNENGLKKEDNWINLKSSNYCTGCDYCQEVNPGFCAIDDGHNEILRQYIRSDKVAIITPVQFGCCNLITKNFIDRTQPLFLPFQVSKDGKSVMKGRYNKYPDLVFIGICDDEDIDVSETFEKFIKTCNLSAASNKVDIKIVLNSTDITCIKALMQ